MNADEAKRAKARDKVRRWRVRNPDHVCPPGDWFRQTRYGLEKRCTVCREWLPAEECFTSHNFGAGGFSNECNACTSEKRRARRLRSRIPVSGTRKGRRA